MQTLEDVPTFEDVEHQNSDAATEINTPPALPVNGSNNAVKPKHCPKPEYKRIPLYINWANEVSNFFNSLGYGITSTLSDLKSGLGYLKSNDKAYRDSKLGYSLRYTGEIPYITVINHKTGDKPTFNGFDVIKKNKENGYSYTPVVKQPTKEDVETTRRNEEREKKAKLNALKEDIALFDKLSTTPIGKGSQYLSKKGLNTNQVLGARYGNTPIPSHNSKYSKEYNYVAFLLEVLETGNAAGLQVINDKTGKKLFSTGLITPAIYIIYGNDDIAVCEGIATGYSVAMHTGKTVVCALYAGNIPRVVEHLAKLNALCNRTPSKITVYCDNDQWKGGANVGLDAAIEVAEQFEDVEYCVPCFNGLDVSSKPTDFNDLANLVGNNREEFNKRALRVKKVSHFLNEFIRKFDTLDFKSLTRVEDILRYQHNSKLINSLSKYLPKNICPENGFKDLDFKEKLKGLPLSVLPNSLSSEILELVRDNALLEYKKRYHIEGSELIEITRFNSQYIPDDLIPPPTGKESIIFIKSPMGTGKTFIQRKLIDKAKKDNKRLGYTAHRTSIANGQAVRLDIDGYQELANDEIEKAQCVSVCVNSIGKIGDRYFLVIDECEQTLRAVANIKNNCMKIHQDLEDFIKNTPHLMLADADLSPLTVELVRKLRPDTPIRICVNKYKPKQGCKGILYTDKQILLSQAKAAIESGKRVIFAFTYKNTATEIYDLLSSKYPNKRGILRTSETTGSDESNEFDNNPTELAKGYDYIIYNTSLGAGVSIDDKPELSNTVVFCLYEGKDIIPSDVWQLVNRYRGMKELHVYIQGYVASHPPRTKQEILENELAENEGFRDELAKAMLKILNNVTPFETRESITNYTDSVADVRAFEESQRTDIKTDFIRLGELAGWNFCYFKDYITAQLPESAKPEDAKALLKSFEKQAKSTRKELSKSRKQAKQDYCESVAAAKSISRTEIEELISKPKKTRDENLSLKKALLKEFYKLDESEVTPEFIKRDNEGKLQLKIKKTELSYFPYEYLIVDSLQKYKEESILHFKNPLLLKELFEHTTALYGVKALPNHQYSYEGGEVTNQDDCVTEFKAWAMSRASALAGAGYRLNTNFSEKPLQYINQVMSSIGIKTTVREVDNGNGGKKRFYKLDEQSLEELNVLLLNRFEHYWKGKLQQWQDNQAYSDSVVNRASTPSVVSTPVGSETLPPNLFNTSSIEYIEKVGGVESVDTANGLQTTALSELKRLSEGKPMIAGELYDKSTVLKRYELGQVAYLLSDMRSKGILKWQTGQQFGYVTQ